jgi:hypothetical protein
VHTFQPILNAASDGDALFAGIDASSALQVLRDMLRILDVSLLFPVDLQSYECECIGKGR